MSDSERPLPRELIGNYRLIRQIGRGGMGAVYEALHQGVGGRAAIKILRSEVAGSSEISERFFDEARAANSVEHPSIIKIFDSGQTSDGLCYLTMEFLDGETLAHRIKVLGRLSVASAIRFARQIASALASVHHRGVIHRDLKPENLMIVKDPESPGGERIKVLDFGIARLAADLRTREGTTESGVVLGTPTYMSPEQCHGAKQVTSQSDVYSLGIIVYKMLAGQPPFVSAGIGALIAMHLTETPARVETHNPAVPGPLSDLISKMLAKSAGERPTMSEVEQCLRAMTSVEELPAPHSRSEIVTRKMSPIDLLALAREPNAPNSSSLSSHVGVPVQTLLLQPPSSEPPKSESAPTLGQTTGPQGRTRRLLRYLVQACVVAACIFGAVVCANRSTTAPATLRDASIGDLLSTLPTAGAAPTLQQPDLLEVNPPNREIQNRLPRVQPPELASPRSVPEPEKSTVQPKPVSIAPPSVTVDLPDLGHAPNSLPESTRRSTPLPGGLRDPFPRP